MIRGKQPNTIAAAISGAFIALVIAFACSHLLTRFGLGIVSASNKNASSRPAALSSAGLELYAMQHVTLVGSGTVRSQIGGDNERVSASITLPVMLSTLVPIVALVLGGCGAAMLGDGGRRRNALISAVIGGVLYAAVLTCLSSAVRAQVDPSALPSYGETEFNPPDILFSPATSSALVCTVFFGIAFMCLGALIATRRTGGERNPGGWWVCGKAAVAVALAVQVVMAVGLQVWLAMEPRTGKDGGRHGRLTQMLPSAAGIGYAMIHGATVAGGIESGSSLMKTVQRPAWGSVNLYAGIRTGVGRDESCKPPTPYIWTAAVVLVALMAGLLAVRWGSRGGSIPTAARIVVVHTAYLAVAMWLCGIGWSATTRVGDITATTRVFVAPQWNWIMLATAFGVFVFAILGAHIRVNGRMEGLS